MVSRPAPTLDAALDRGLADTGIPGAVVLVARHGRVLHEVARGWAQTHDEHGALASPVPMRPDTLFDVASLTKVVATTATAMALVDRGRLDLDAPARRYLPGLTADGRDAITVAHLLEHRAGLPAWYPLFAHTDERAEAVELACRRPLVAAPGSTRVYSDVGMILAGAVVERAADGPLDAVAARLVFDPLGMADSGFRPDRSRPAAATSTGNPAEARMLADAGLDPGAVPWRRHTLVGEANDFNAARALAGVAGHAGLFSTAADLARFAGAVAAGGVVEGRRLWSAGTVARFLRPGADPTQALGFWLRRAAAALADPAAGDDSFGHRGFTGCELAASPAAGWVAVLLTNRLHTEQDPPTDHGPIWTDVVGVAVGSPAGGRR